MLGWLFGKEKGYNEKNILSVETYKLLGGSIAWPIDVVNDEWGGITVSAGDTLILEYGKGKVLLRLTIVDEVFEGDSVSDLMLDAIRAKIDIPNFDGEEEVTTICI